jgi:hypothetical protein
VNNKNKLLHRLNIFYSFFFFIKAIFDASGFTGISKLVKVTTNDVNLEMQKASNSEEICVMFVVERRNKLNSTPTGDGNKLNLLQRWSRRN